MNDIKIIGIGSPFDHDTIGWQVINNLKQQHILNSPLSEQVELIESDRPGINLIQMLQGARFVILIDAILDECKHGEIIRLNKSQLVQSQYNLSSHDLDASSAIALAEKLQLLPETIMILGLGIDPEQEEPINAAAIHSLTEVVVCELEAYFSHITTT